MSRRFIPFSGSSRTIREEGQPSSLIRNNSHKREPIMDRHFRSRSNTSETQLVETIDIEQDFATFKQATIKHFKPEILYNKGSFSDKTKMIRKADEISLCVGDNSQEILPLIGKEICKQESQKEYKFIHIGLIIIGIKG